MQRTYGWKRQREDKRDYKLVVPRFGPTLPKKVDLEKGFPPVTDQGQVGSCTGHSSVGLLAFREKAQGEVMTVLSALMSYYNARSLEGTTKQDSGAEIRDVIKGANKWGVCADSLWPLTQPFNKKPASGCYTEAKHHEALQYAAAPQTHAALQTLLANGNPIIFGFDVPQAFEGDKMAKTGRMSGADWKTGVVGGHAVVLCGYDQSRAEYKVRNSWGTGWGVNGYFFMPAAFVVSSACSDFWHVDLLSE